jgi:uncharacterized protein YdeI (YjbR/CyaY-like superfamily)
MAGDKKKLYVTKRAEWRKWLQKNGEAEKEIWLVHYKKHTGTPSLAYDDAVEEALCFGWIDSTVRRLDDARYMQKYTPRKRESSWSELNKKRANRMIKQGRMAEAGLAKIREAKKNGRWDKAGLSQEPKGVPAELKKALAANKKARQHFDALAPSYKKHYIGWIASAKREETRTKRANEAIGLLSKNKKLGLR